MNLKKQVLVGAAIVVGLLVASPAPARADEQQQHRRVASRGEVQNRQAAPQRSTPQRSAPAQRSRPATPAQQGPRTSPFHRAEPRAPAQAPRFETVPRGRDQARTFQDRGRAYQPLRVDRAPRAVVAAPRGYAVPRGSVAPRPFFERSRVVRFTRPYYSFRPRFSLGFGLFIGYPVAYPTWYDPYSYGGYFYGTPRVAYGGVSFDIQPLDADVYVDGAYMGQVGDFASDMAPLTLVAGYHRVEIRAPGYQVMAFSISVVPGQVTPYQGSLAWVR